MPWANDVLANRERQNVMLMASLRARGFETRVRVTDISKGGLKVKGPACGPTGSEVAIELPGVGWVAAIIVWARAETYGLHFDNPIDPAATRQAVSGTYVRPAIPPGPLRRRVA